MEDLQAEIAIVKQTQDDINGYLNSLTTEIDLLRASYDELKTYVATVEARLSELDEVHKIRVELDEVREKLTQLSL